MKRAYKAILHGDRVEWLDGAPDADGPLPTLIFINTEEPGHPLYDSLLHGCNLKWLDGCPETNGPVPVYVVILNKPRQDHPENNGAIAVAMLEILADKGTFDHIEDPVTWQREIRKDRPLPFRDYDVD